MTNQKTQMTICPEEQIIRRKAENCFLSHWFGLPIGLVTLNARTTVTVLARTEETATEKVVPKTACRRRQEIFVGRPMNSRGHRKDRMSERRRMKLRLRLLAFTIGVSLCFTNIPNMIIVPEQNNRTIKTREIPIVSP